jgi:hypothetical protein
VFVLLHTSESPSPPGFTALLKWAEVRTFLFLTLLLFCNSLMQSKHVPLEGLLATCRSFSQSQIQNPKPYQHHCSVGASSLETVLGCTGN